MLAKDEQIIFRDCGEAFKSGLTTSGVYTLTFPNSTEEIKVRRCLSFSAPWLEAGGFRSRTAAYIVLIPCQWHAEQSKKHRP